jgi:hypothetical protein
LEEHHCRDRMRKKHAESPLSFVSQELVLDRKTNEASRGSFSSDAINQVKVVTKGVVECALSLDQSDEVDQIDVVVVIDDDKVLFKVIAMLTAYCPAG